MLSWWLPTLAQGALLGWSALRYRMLAPAPGGWQLCDSPRPERRWRPLPLTTCKSCERKHDDRRKKCPYCGAVSASPARSKGIAGSPTQSKGLAVAGQGVSGGWKGKAMFALVVLVALNVWRALTIEVGPDSEVEALHSEEEAVRVCREGVQSQFAARDPLIVPPEQAEYLQGGEYEVQLVVELDDRGFRTGEVVLCQLQFTAETGWMVEDVSFVPN